MEATLHTRAVVRVLRPFFARLWSPTPLRTKAIGQAKVKTDKTDAEVLAQLLRCDYLPLVWEPTSEVEHAARSSVAGPGWWWSAPA